MNRKSILSILFIVLSTALSHASAGKIVLSNDEWEFTNVGFSQSVSDSGIFASNVASWFTGGSAGNFLAYSTNFGLTGSALANTMTSAGHSWTATQGVSFDLTTLSAYDGIFLAGNAATNSLLIDYVNHGGNVYLAGGTGWGGPYAEANRWNSFLNAFGLGFGAPYNGVGGNIPISSSHEIFNGVDYLYQNNGNDALDIDITDPKSQLLVSYRGHGLYAVYDDTTSVPEPSALLLLATGIFGGVIARRKARA
jgi:hypothetical protein